METVREHRKITFVLTLSLLAVFLVVTPVLADDELTETPETTEAAEETSAADDVTETPAAAATAENPAATEVIMRSGSTEAPLITLVQLHDHGTTGTPAALTPRQTYDIKVTVSDADGLGELESLLVKVYDDSTGSQNESESVFNTVAVHEQHAVSMTWTRSTNSVVFNAAGSWSLGTSTLPSEEQLDGIDDPTSFTFIFPLTIGKVAHETSGDGYEWYVGARIADSEALTGYGHFNGTYPYLNMNWYGEVSVPSNAAVNWGGLPAGATYSDANAKQALGGPVTYTANGDHAYTLKSSTSWTAADLSEAVLDDDLSGDTDHFALKAWPSDDYNSAVQLDPAGNFVTLGAVDGGTADYGQAIESYHFWIALSSAMTTPRVYSGTLTFGIANN